jgi:hypothetical protein
MIKYTLICLLWLVFISVGIKGQQSTFPSYEKAQDKAKLLFTTDISEQQYCSKREMVLRLKVTYKNIGTVPIILDKRISWFINWKTKRISGKMKRNFKSTTTPSDLTINEHFKGELPEEESFIVLKPNEEYSYIQKGGNIVRLYDGDDEETDRLREGKYTIQYSAYTWYYSLSSFNEYRQKWKNKGFLWSKNITSKPMLFEVQENTVTSKCEL